MGLTFVWLQLSIEDVGRALSGSSPEVLLRVSLALYYAAWVAGTTHDTTEQEYAYAVGPSDRSATIKTIGAAVTLSGVFAGLCLVNSARVFAVVLAVFLLVNFAWWRLLAKRTVDGPMAESDRRYEEKHDYIGVILVANMRNYISGEWQKWRFGVGGVAVAAILYVAFFGVPGPISRRALFSDRDRTLGIMILTYVCGIEFWIWVERLKLNLARRALQPLRAQYQLVRRAR